jgi:hypothetical protein
MRSYSMKTRLLIMLIPICLHLNLLCQVQADSFPQLFQLQTTARFATADRLGNIYVITNSNTLEKYAADGQSPMRYTNNQLGTPACIDVVNPLKIMVWYADFRTIVFLDRSLTELGRLDLPAVGFPNIRTIAGTPDGNLWTYDDAAFLVRKMEPDGTILFESQNLSLLTHKTLNIACIRDDGNQVYLANPNEGLMILDAYAQSSRTRLMKNLTDFQIIGNLLYTLQGNVLHIENLKAFSARDLPLPVQTAQGKNLRWLGVHRVFIQTGDTTLSVFSY